MQRQWPEATANITTNAVQRPEATTNAGQRPRSNGNSNGNGNGRSSLLDIITIVQIA
jgi:hypothetical protein